MEKDAESAHNFDLLILFLKFSSFLGLGLLYGLNIIQIANKTNSTTLKLQ